MSKIALYFGMTAVGVAGVAGAVLLPDLINRDQSSPPVAEQAAAVASKVAPQPVVAQPVVQPAPSNAPSQTDVVEPVAEPVGDEGAPKAQQVEETTEDGTEDVAVQPAEPVVDAPVIAEPVEVQPAAPVFDLVRAEADGMTLVAGEGAPGGSVGVFVDGAEHGVADIASDGRFVLFLDLPPSDKGRVISLRQTLGDAVTASAEDVILAPTPVAVPDVAEPPETPAPEIAALTPEVPEVPETPVAIETAQVETAPADVTIEAEQIAEQATGKPIEPTTQPDVALAVADAVAAPLDVVTDAPIADLENVDPPQQDVANLAAPAGTATALSETPAPQAPAQTAPAPQSVAPTVLVSNALGVEALKSAPVSPGDVALDSISYDDEGDVLLAGRGQDTAFVRIYLDNSPITTSRIRSDGRWRVELPQVDTGTYTLRVDQLDAQGDVLARVESPFLREDPVVLAASANRDGPVQAITVQPGNTLWAIARDRYGEGVEYVRVFDANRDRIRNPDLIYPGQIFDLPK